MEKKQRKFSVQHNFLGWKSNTQKIEAFARWIKRFRFFFGTRNLSKLPKLKSFFFGLNDEKRHLHCRETNTSQNWFQLDYNWIWCFFSQKKLKAGKEFPLSAFDRLIECSCGVMESKWNVYQDVSCHMKLLWSKIDFEIDSISDTCCNFGSQLRPYCARKLSAKVPINQSRNFM